jgi:chromosome partitioning protein
MLTTAAYLASDYILVPIKPEFLSTIGLPLLARSLADFHDQYDEKKVEFLGIVFNHASDYEPEEARSKNEVRSVAKPFGWYVFDAEVSYSRSYPRGAREGQPIFRTKFARSSQKSRAFQFAAEFVNRVGL